MDNISFGISYGYPNYIDSRKGALDYIARKGLKHIRIIEPFIKGIDINHQLFADKIKSLIDLGFENFLIGIHGIPYSWLGQYNLSVLNKKQLAASKWCNRFAPKDWVAYEKLLHDFIDTLDYNNLLPKCEFEFGHEVNALNYYWGTLSDFEKMFALSGVIQQTGRPLYLANFSTELVRKGTNNHEWLDFMNRLPYDTYGFSSSLYRNTWNGEFDVNNNTYPTSPAIKIISEYNIYTKILAGSPQEAEFNSPLYVTRLFEMLKFAKSKNISRIYLHTLCNDSRDQMGRLGLFELVVINNQKRWMPKEAAKQFLKIWDVNVGCAGMVRGFEVLEDRITTAYGKSIIFDTNGEWEIV